MELTVNSHKAYISITGKNRRHSHRHHYQKQQTHTEIRGETQQERCITRLIVLGQKGASVAVEVVSTSARIKSVFRLRHLFPSNVGAY